jgi:hypothetical protein
LENLEDEENGIMKNLLGKKRIISGFFLTFFLTLSLMVPVSAERTVWSDPSYNFKDVKSIWVEEPAYTYDFKNFIFDDPKDYVNNYPNPEEKTYKILRKAFQDKIRKELYVVFEQDVTAQKAGGFAPVTEILIEDPKNANLVLSIKIQDLGWFFSYYPAYDSWETVTDHDIYYLEDRDGKKRRMTREITRQVLVRHSAGYNVRESAAAEFLLRDTKSGKIIWRCIDKRDRANYSKNGPESMLERIIKDAFDNMNLKK